MKYKQLASALAAVSFGISCQSHRLGMEYGMDISHYQGKIDWAQLSPESSGKKFIIHKATEGSDFQDGKFLENWVKMCDAGFRPGVYHVVRFGTSRVEDQMNNLLTQLRKTNNWTNESIISLNILDEKLKLNEERSLMSSIIQDFVERLKDDERVTPYIYTRQNLWDPYVEQIPEIVKECPLWIARWRDVEPSKTELPIGWNEWKIWQYTDQGSVPAITQNTVCFNKMKPSS